MPEIQEVTAPEIQDVTYKEFIARGQKWNTATSKQKKGKGAGIEHTVLVPNTGETTDSFFARMRKAVGESNWDKVLQSEVVRQSCRDAEKDSETKYTDGVYTEQQWFEEYCAQYLPGARQAGEGVKIIREKLKAVMSELKPLIDMTLKKETRERMTPEQTNRYLTLSVEFSDLCEKDDKAGRSGKTKKKV